MNGQEIIERLKEFFGENNISAYAYGDYIETEQFNSADYPDLDWKARKEECLNQLGLGKIVQVKQRGGEGEGETWYVVNHFVDHDVYIKTSGFYSSYNGTDFDYGWGDVVSPTEKTITVYE